MERGPVDTKKIMHDFLRDFRAFWERGLNELYLHTKISIFIA